MWLQTFESKIFDCLDSCLACFLFAHGLRALEWCLSRFNFEWELWNYCINLNLVNNVWSSISAKNRSLYSILDLLYFMLPYTLCWFRGLTFRFYMVLFVFHIQYHEFGMPNWRFSATFIKRSIMQVSTFEVLFSTSKFMSWFMYSASFDILPQSIEREHRGRS